MRAKDYVSVGELICSIRDYKETIESNTTHMNEDLEELNELLKNNGQPVMKLDDIEVRKPFKQRPRYRRYN